MVVQLGRFAKNVLPIGWIKDQIAKNYQRFLLAHALRELIQSPWSVLNTNSDLLKRLIQGWGNQSWSASDEYLMASIDELARTDGPILECGSGLSTIIVGVIAQKMGREMWTLEHSEDWGTKVSQILEKLEITAVHLCVKPLRNYGDYSWYDPPLDTMPANFGLVICDGPPGGGHGGRSGFLPVMQHRLASYSTILLDDTAREEERKIAEHWSDSLSAPLEFCGVNKAFAAIRIGDEISIGSTEIVKKQPCSMGYPPVSE